VVRNLMDRVNRLIMFYDVGRTEESYGADPLNRLYVDVANKTISGLYKNKLYTITEIGSNHE